jgi:regulator of protease activity HflC (stomatin/prohibitin superfamily)
MRRITVHAYEKALVFKNGKLIQVFSEGKYWIGFNCTVNKFDVTEMFYHEMELDLLIEHPEFTSAVDIIDVKDNEIVIQYKAGNFHKVLRPGRYCYWKDGITYTYDRIDLNEVEVDKAINRKVLTLPGLAYYVSTHVVDSYEKGLLYVDGKLVKDLGPGTYYFWKNEKQVIIKKVDTRKQQVEISGQELLTRDKAALRINLFANYEVIDVRKALDASKDFARQLYIIIQMGIREYIGQYTLDELLANKTSASPYIMEYATERVAELGVQLLSCGLRDIILPGDVKAIMNQVLIAEKKAQANVIMRREETASTRSLLNTAKLMEDNEMLFRLKEMEYIEKISEKIGEITVNGGSQVMDQLRSIMSKTSS